MVAVALEERGEVAEGHAAPPSMPKAEPTNFAASERPYSVGFTVSVGVPTVCVDRQYTGSASGQLRTRVQAFVESLEIKNINMAKEGL